MRQPTLTEQKLVILYALDRLGSSTSLQLLRFVVDNEMMDYIEMQLATAELAEAGLLRKLDHELGTLYALSEQGHASLELFAKKIPFSRRQHIEEVAKEWRALFSQEKQVLGDFAQQPGGEYLVRLRLMEQELTLLDMKISVPTRELAGAVLRRWPQRADTIYQGLMAELGEEESNGE